jgi:hypothetical protein
MTRRIALDSLKMISHHQRVAMNTHDFLSELCSQVSKRVINEYLAAFMAHGDILIGHPGYHYSSGDGQRKRIANQCVKILIILFCNNLSLAAIKRLQTMSNVLQSHPVASLSGMIVSGDGTSDIYLQLTGQLFDYYGNQTAFR